MENKERKMFLFDCETTGLDPRKSFILTIGGILCSTDGNTVEEFYRMINWKCIFNDFYIPEDTTRVHGITDAYMEANGQHPVEVLCDLHDVIMNFVGAPVNQWLDGSTSRLDYIVAFNLPYDLNMMISNLKYLISLYESGTLVDGGMEKMKICNLLCIFSKIKGNGSECSDEAPANSTLFIDSLIIDQIFHFEVDGVKVKHDLDSVGRRYGLPKDENAHNAIADTRRMFSLFKMQMNEVESIAGGFSESFEDRLIRKYNRNQEYWNRRRGPDGALNYLGESMVKLKTNFAFK